MCEGLWSWRESGQNTVVCVQLERQRIGARKGALGGLIRGKSLYRDGENTRRAGKKISKK